MQCQIAAVTARKKLGIDLTIGEEVYDLSGAFSISIGPLDWETYLTFQPDGERFAQTRSLVELYNTDPLSFTIEMKLHEGEVPEMRLSSDDQAGRLGFTSWVRTDELPATSVTFASTSGATVESRAAMTEATAETEDPCEAAAT